MGLAKYVEEVEADSPTGFWKLQETSGTTADDAGSSPHDGTYTGSPTLAGSGPVDNVVAPTFNGSSQYVEIASHDDLTPLTGDFTVEIWCRSDLSSPTNDMMVGKIGNGTNREWFLSWLSGFRAVVANQEGDEALDATGGAHDTTDWHQVVLEFDYSADQVELYVDGVSVTTASPGASGTKGTTNTGIAMRVADIVRSTISFNWDGSLTMLSIYKGATLGATRVAAHYDAMYAIEFAAPITGTPTIPSPTVTGGLLTIEPDLLTATPTIPSPTVVGTQTVSANLLTGTPTIPSPTVLLAVDQTVSPWTLQPLPQVLAPSVSVAGTQTITPPVLSATPTIASPAVGQPTSPAGSTPPTYVVKAVDIYGTGTTLASARAEEIVWTVNEPESAAISWPKNSYSPATVDVLDEIQIYRDGDLKFWGPILSIDAGGGSEDVRAACAGVGWYFRRIVLDAQRRNLIDNGDFEDGLDGWAVSSEVAAFEETSDTLRGSKAVKLVTFSEGAEAHISRSFTLVGSGVGTYVIFRGWYKLLNKVSETGHAYERRGLYVEARDADGNLVDLDYFPIDAGTVAGEWRRSVEFGMHVPADTPWTFNVRAYCPQGAILWDEIGAFGMESISTAKPGDVNNEVDIAQIMGRLVAFAQSSTFGPINADKTPLNIGTHTPATGITEARHYQMADHTELEQALREFTDRDDGPDWSIELTPTTRTFRVWPGGKGTDLSGTVDLTYGGANVAAYDVSVDGAGTATKVTTLGDGDGPDREESEQTDRTLVPNSLTLQRIERTPKDAPVRSLDEIATGVLAQTSRPEPILEVTSHDRSLIDSVEVGDRVAASIADGWVAQDDDYRVVRKRLDCVLDLATFTLNEIRA